MERFATIRRGLRVPPERDLIVGQGATILGDIEGGGCVYLAKGAIVRGSVRAGLDVVVGSQVHVEGEVQARGNVLLLEGAQAGGSVRAAGRIRVIGAHVGGPVHALGDIEVRGDATLIDVHAAGRVRSLWPMSAEPSMVGPASILDPSISADKSASELTTDSFSVGQTGLLAETASEDVKQPLLAKR